MGIKIAAVVAIGWCGFAPQAAEQEASFQKLQAMIRPDPKKSFESIPWMTSLWEARKKAAAEDKPIVLWSGDPHPLGVT